MIPTWRDVAIAYPEFVSWVVQTFGPLPDGEVRQEDYERFAAAYESRHNLDVSETKRI